MTLPPGSRLGRYDIATPLGAGGMGEVYRAFDSQLGRAVAIKILPNSSPEFRARFEREARAIASFQHPNICTLYDVGRQGDTDYLVMEYVEGETLATRLQQGPFEPAIIRRVATQVAEALSAAHDKGLVHRDLKPANVMLTRSGNVKVLDFGIAKEALEPEGATRVRNVADTRVGFIVGTPQYMSPEQAMGRSVDARSDIFSLGIVLYELASGRRPFVGTSDVEVIDQILNRDPIPLSAVGAAPQGWLDNVVTRCLQKQPDQRFQTARELLDALRDEGRPSAPAQQHHNLPTLLTRFIGRQPELESLSHVLRDARLLTLTGTGGVGKTRLAVELAARRAGEYEAGVHFVDLAAVSDPSLVVQSIASSLRVREEAAQPIERTLLAFLRERQLLLILDNCEQIVAACAQVVHTLLTSAPRLTVLTTSREALGVAGESVFRVPSLSVAADAAGRLEGRGPSDAVQLFVDRARQAKHGFSLNEQNAGSVARICERLDGVPLAIELAAARVGAFPVDQIEARLRDSLAFLSRGSRTAVPRHQTLVATIEWSYGLLSEREQTVFRQLAVFAGGWSAEAAEYVCADERTTPDAVIDALAALADKSMIVLDERDELARYRFLVSVAEYAARLFENDNSRSAVTNRHRRFFTEVADSAWNAADGPALPEWRRRLQIDHENLMVALARCGPDDTEPAVRLDRAIGYFWLLRGQYSQAQIHLVRALGRFHSLATPPLSEVDFELALLSTESRLADVYWYQEKYRDAEPLYAHALARRSHLLGPDHRDTLKVQSDLASLYVLEKRWTEAEHLTLRTLDGQKRHLGEEHPDTLVTLNNLQGMYYLQSRLEEAERIAVQVLEARRRVRGTEHPETATAQHNLGSIYSRMGRFSDAEAQLRSALELKRRALGSEHPSTYSTQSHLGAVYRAQGRYEEAESLLVAAYTGLSQLSPSTGHTEQVVENLALLCESQGRAAEAATWRSRLATFGPGNS